MQNTYNEHIVIQEVCGVKVHGHRHVTLVIAPFPSSWRRNENVGND